MQKEKPRTKVSQEGIVSNKQRRINTYSNYLKMRQLQHIFTFAFIFLKVSVVKAKITSCISYCPKDSIVLDCTRNITFNPPCMSSCIFIGSGRFESYQKNLYLIGCPFLGGVIAMPRIEYLYSAVDNPVLFDNSFHFLCSAKIMNLSQNAIETIEPNAFDCAIYIEKLDLARNKITHLPGSLFRGMSRLRILYVEENHLTEISFEALQLEVLFVHKNKLLSFYASSMHFLESLNLSENPTLEINNITLRDLTGLTEIFLENCSLVHLSDDLFHGTPNLRALSLHRNSIKSFPVTLYELPLLSFLGLTVNEISELPDKPFANLLNLKHLHLSENKLSAVRKDYFTGLGTLYMLNLTYNQIEEVESSSFDSLISLEFLLIGHNRLLTLHGSNVLQYNKLLKYIDISNNRLTSIRNIKWYSLEHLTNFKADSNEISELLIPTIRSSEDLVILLMNNRIQRVFISSENTEPEFFSDRSVVINLQDNPLECDCDAYVVFTLFNKDNYSRSLINLHFFGGFVCQNPPKLRGKDLSTLNATDFMCDTCHTLCNCRYTLMDYVSKEINCSNRNYETIAPIASFNATSLLISQNNLTTLAFLSASCWENLTVVHAEGNRISGSEIYLPNNLKFLGLENNEMTQLPTVLTKHAAKVKDFKMTLSNNPWTCDCSSKDLKQFLSEHSNQVDDVNEVRCIFANKSKSLVNLIDMKDNDLCSDEALTIAKIICGAAAALIITVSCSVLYYRNKVQVVSFLYTHCNFCYTIICCDRVIDETKRFDCFISYGTTDTEVMLAIVDKLENEAPRLNFCIHERNWVPGEYITNNIIWSIQNSRKTLIVLSKEFVSSKWFNVEFHIAYQQSLEDRRNRIIMVLKDKPDENHLDKDVLHVLSTTTYLEWGERWFWEKLRYALHQEDNFEETKGKSNGCKCLARRNSTVTNDVPVT